MLKDDIEKQEVQALSQKYSQDTNYKIDLTSLTKIALQNTARPMMDVKRLGKEKSQYIASPRQQGAGLINVANALRNEVVATFKTTDSKGLVNSYGSVSLKE